MAVSAASLVEREGELTELARVVAAARDGVGGAVLVEGPPGIGKSSLLTAARGAADGLRVVSARGGELGAGVSVWNRPTAARAGAHGCGRGRARRAARRRGRPGRAGAPGARRRSRLRAAVRGAPRSLLVRGQPRCAAAAARRRGRRPVGGSRLAALSRLPGAPARGRAAGADAGEPAARDRAAPRPARRARGDPGAASALSQRAERGSRDPARGRRPRVRARRRVRRRLPPGDGRQSLSPARAARRARAARDPADGAKRRSRSAAELARRGPRGAGAAAAPAAGMHRARDRSRRPLRSDRALAGRPRRGTGRGRCDSSCRHARRGVDPRDGPPACLRPPARAFERLREAPLERPGRGAPAGRPGAHRRRRGGRSDRRPPPRRASPDQRRDRRHPAPAAESASTRGAPDVAVSYLRRALAEPPLEELRPAIALELGEASLRAGELEAAAELLREAARGLADEDARTRAANALGSTLTQLHRPRDAVTELTAVIDALPESAREPGLRLQAMRWAAAGASVAVWRDLRASGDRFAVTGATAETTGERLAAAVSALHVVRARTASEGRALALRALGQGELLADVGPESAAFWFAPLALLWADALEEAHDACTDVIETARRHGSLPGFALATQIRAYVSWRSGSLADAEADAASALPHESLPGFPRQYGDAALVNVLLARGRPADAAELIRQQGLDRGSGQGLYYLQARARLHAALERSNEALDDLLACGSVEQELEITTPAFCNWRTDAVPLLASLGRAEEAHRLAEQEVERCRAFGAASPLGASLRTLGEIEGREDGIVLLREAVEVLTGSPARLEHALALLALGEALRRAGRRTDARAPLREALELARGCGADAVSARANDELVLAGARPRRDPTESRSRLTPGELRVARLAAEGMTNREIAQGLFLTENTIETHLRSVFRKLTIGSRSQLARAL